MGSKNFWVRQVNSLGRKTANLAGDIAGGFDNLGRKTSNLFDDVTGVTAAAGAAKAQQAGLDKAQASLEKMLNQAMDTQKPWLEAGRRGLSQLEAGINSGAFDSQQGQYSSPQYQGPAAFQDMKFDFEADPGYQFRLAEGNKAVQASAAARGGLFSGKTGTDLQDYSQGLASQEYGNAYNRFADQRDYSYGQFGDNFNRDRALKTDKYNRLASLAGVGQMTAGNVANQQIEQGANLGNLAMQKGNIGAQRAQAGYQGGMNLFNTGLQAAGIAAKFLV